MRNVFFWDVTPCGSCKNRRFGGTYRLYLQDEKIVELGTTLAVTSNWSTRGCASCWRMCDIVTWSRATVLEMISAQTSNVKTSAQTKVGPNSTLAETDCRELSTAVSKKPQNYCSRCKIWGFHGGDYEECRLLGYKTHVCTSQETHYLYTTELSQLMLCKIWGFHGVDYEECRLLGCYVVLFCKNGCFGGT
jgi:hypothetical protein